MAVASQARLIATMQELVRRVYPQRAILFRSLRTPVLRIFYFHVTLL
jgi:hypothetical protein